jgi:Baseplate J-like protein
MITKIYTIEKLKSLIMELFYNKTTRITAASDESGINALFFGGAKVGQKAMKDFALVESHLFPQYAYGSNLDNAAALFGAPIRQGASGSSTYLLIRAATGTVYTAVTNVFSGENGIDFELTEDFTVDTSGFGYAKVRSTSVGAVTNVNANTLLKVNPIPNGHVGVTNEYAATGGRDVESDDDYRLRVIEHPNIMAQKTLVYLAEIFRLTNEDVLRVLNYGIDSDAKLTLAVVLQNGADLTNSELANLLDASREYISLSDISPSGDNTGIKLINPIWYGVGGDTITDTGIDFRIQIYDNYDVEAVRRDIQIALSNYIDFRYWDWSTSLQWSELLALIKGVVGVRFVPDAYFHPSYDITVPLGQLPRIKKFVMRDLTGNIIFSNTALISVFYPII